MANSLRAKLSKLRHDGNITDAEYQALIKKLDGHDAEIRAKAIDEFVEKLIGRLKEASHWEDSTFDEDGYCNDDAEEVIYLHRAIEIVSQLAEEYRQDLDKNSQGWIPVSIGNPKETGLYQVTVDDNDEPVITAMYLAEVDIWSFHAGYGNYMNVIAWQPLPAPYQPKGE